jgi:hypothetical protein
MLSKLKQNGFLLWLFLNQPIFSRTSPAVLSPSRFWHLHKVQLLKRCWDKDSERKDHPHH